MIHPSRLDILKAKNAYRKHVEACERCRGVDKLLPGLRGRCREGTSLLMAIPEVTP